MSHPSSVAARLPRAVDRARWIVATIACGIGALFAANSAPESGASRAAAPASRLASLSSFVHVSPDEGAAIAGLVIAGPTDKILLVRAIGPGLRPFGLTDGLPDPILRLFDATGLELARNAGWTGNREPDEIRLVTAEVGAIPLPAGSADATLLVRLAPGVYTLAVDSMSGGAGAVLTEVYEAGCASSLVNLATIATVDATRPSFYGSFRVTGTAPKKFLIRAVGPALAAMGVECPLPDPKLILYREAGAATTARNDDWGEPAAGDGTEPAAIAATAAACGAFALPAGGKDAAVLVTLAPGAYTVAVSGKGGDAGPVLLEIYAVP